MAHALPVNPALLLWVREQIGIPAPIAARKIGVSEERLAQFESGEVCPSPTQLRKIGNVYKRPAAFFYTSSVPDAPDVGADFRTLPETEDSSYSSKLWDALFSAQQRQEAARDMAKALAVDPPSWPVQASRSTPPTALANDVRAHLGISNASAPPKDQYKLLRHWIEIVENSGVLVGQFSGVDVSEARGFSLKGREHPLIALNGADAPRGKVFTLFHELAHLSLGMHGVCDLHRATNEVDWVEPYCNEVAGQTLVPNNELLGHPLLISQQGPAWSDTDLQGLADTFGVSREVIFRRLLNLDKTTQAEYQAFRARARAQLQAKKEAAGKGGGFLPFPKKVVRDNGRRFVRLALAAHDSRAITGLELSRALGGIALKHLPEIRSAA